ASRGGTGRYAPGPSSARRRSRCLSLVADRIRRTRGCGRRLPPAAYPDYSRHANSGAHPSVFERSLRGRCSATAPMSPLASDIPVLLQMRGIRKAFPGVLALDDVNFELRRGEVHALLGENGAGKSTLMKILSGACSRDAGEILIDERPVALNSPREAQAIGISTIYQEFNLVPHLSAAENIYLGREP